MTTTRPAATGAEPGDLRPLVIQTEELDDACRVWLEERCEVVRCAPEDKAFGGLLARASGLAVRTYTRVDSALLDCAPGLKVVGRAGVGVDNIDVAACRGRGVEVVYTPDANTRAVVELVTAFVLDALRPRVFLDRAVDLAEWKRIRGELVAERQLSELTLGVLGLGRVGSAVARVGAALGMRVIFNDVSEIDPAARGGAEAVSVEGLFERADVLTVHIDGRAENRRFVGARLLRRLRQGAVLINTSRGFVVENGALAEWLKSDGSGQAVLDVHEPEPFGESYPLLGLRNCRLSPHIGAATRSAHRNMSWVVRDIWRVLSGERAEFPAPAG